MRVDHIGRDTTFGKLIDAVERAEKSRAPIQGIADRLAGYLVYFGLGAAGLTFLVTHNIRSTISVVIVAGACGIAAGTPLAILGAIGRCAQVGSIESRSEHPVAKAILRKAMSMEISGDEPEKFEYTPGNGVVAVRDGAASVALAYRRPQISRVAWRRQHLKCLLFVLSALRDRF